MKQKDISLINNTNHLTISVKSGTIADLELVKDRLITYISKLKEEIKLENDFILAAKKLEDSENLRVIIQRKSFKRPPLYKFKVNGEWKTWSGVGKKPKFLHDKNLEDYLIKSEPNAKYQYTTDKGEVKTWTGVGRKPKELEKLNLRGFPLENFKI